MLRRLSVRGILARVRDEAEPGGPYVYRIAAKALHLLGLPTVEALRSFVLEKVGPLGVDLDGVSRVADSEVDESDVIEAWGRTTSIGMSGMPPRKSPTQRDNSRFMASATAVIAFLARLC